MDNDRNHFLDVLILIDKMQKEATGSVFNNSCSKPLLTNTNPFFNTRPLSFYLCDTTELMVNYQQNGETLNTTVFRVEAINDNFVTVRLLAQSEDTYVATNEFAIININYICALRCLNDINLTI